MFPKKKVDSGSLHKVRAEKDSGKFLKQSLRSQKVSRFSELYT